MEKNEVIEKAFFKACQFLREHPPIDTCDHFYMIQLVCDGKKDPMGYRWGDYFISQVLEEEKEKNNDN